MWDLTPSLAVPASGRTSGLYALNQDRPPERGARIARREERADWASVSDEERGEAGCPARPLVLIQRIQATSDAGQTGLTENRGAGAEHASSKNCAPIHTEFP